MVTGVGNEEKLTCTVVTYLALALTDERTQSNPLSFSLTQLLIASDLVALPPVGGVSGYPWPRVSDCMLTCVPFCVTPAAAFDFLPLPPSPFPAGCAFAAAGPTHTVPFKSALLCVCRVSFGSGTNPAGRHSRHGHARRRSQRASGGAADQPGPVALDRQRRHLGQAPHSRRRILIVSLLDPWALCAGVRSCRCVWRVWVRANAARAF